MLTTKEQAILTSDGGDVSKVVSRNEDYKRLNFGNGLSEYEAIIKEFK